MDWLEYTVVHPEHDKPVRYRVNVSFYRSYWACQFGRGCPGILVTGANLPDIGCCQVGVMFSSDEDFERVSAAVAELTPDDWDLADTDWRERWYYTEKRRVAQKNVHVPVGTQVHETGCILANRSGGSSGKPGCALHHLAERTGRGHWETKPDICWQIPFAVSTSETADGGLLVTMDGSVGSAWGSVDTANMGDVGYWCTETPDAYTDADLVYRTAEGTLRRLLGDLGYDEMAKRLSRVHRNHCMPGETANGGRPLLPILVRQRTAQWENAQDQADVYGAHARDCLNRS
jgi:hypothetical protein